MYIELYRLHQKNKEMQHAFEYILAEILQCFLKYENIVIAGLLC